MKLRPLFYAAMLLSGCAILPPDYEWRQVYPPSLSYEWNIVPASDLHKVCGINPAAMPALGACAIRLVGPRKCVVFSRYTEDHAKLLHAGDGIDLFAHEMKHCAGMDHQGITGVFGG